MRGESEMGTEVGREGMEAATRFKCQQLISPLFYLSTLFLGALPII